MFIFFIYYSPPRLQKQDPTMSHFFGNSKGNSNLQRGLPVGTLYGPEGTDLDKASDEFRTRFGLKRVIERNKNIVNTLTDPKGAIADINKKYQDISYEMVKLYQKYYTKLIEQGVPQGLAQKRVDEYILPLMDAELQIMALEFPYNFGSNHNESNLHMQQILFQTPSSGASALSELAKQNNEFSKNQL